MRIFVTAGNTQVPIDRVRCITNIFTGRTGANIALEARSRGHQVILATSHPRTIDELQAGRALDPDHWSCCPYQTFDELEALMGQHIAEGKQDVVIHCAAVSDYRIGGVFAPAPATYFDAEDLHWKSRSASSPALVDRSAGKVKSDESELWLRLTRTPKLVDRIRQDWRFKGILVKFKLEVGVPETELLARAESSRRQSSADWMVANTLEGSHEWALLGNDDSYHKVTRAKLPAALLDAVEKQYREAQSG